MDYPYANGVVKAIESKLLDKAKLAKLAKADKSGFLKSLSDVGYGRIAAGDDVETAVARELAEFHQMLDEITPDKQATDLFFLTEDAMNIKLLFKRKKYGAPVFDGAAADGTIAFPGIAKAILEDDATDLDPRYLPLLKAIDAKSDGLNAGRLSTIVDRELFAFAFKAAGLFMDDGLKSYLKAKVDFANLMAMFRMKKLGWPVERFDDVYIPGGKYALGLFREAYPSSPVDAARLFQDAYDDRVARIVRDQNEKRNLAVTEALFADLLLEVVEEYRDDSFRIGPIIYYHLEKAREADAVRTLYARADYNRSGA